jgi:hypothetical protein
LFPSDSPERRLIVRFGRLHHPEQHMAKVKIFKKDGSPTSYFWSDKEPTGKREKTVYKQTSEGIKRMKGVHFDPVKNRMHKH